MRYVVMLLPILVTLVICHQVLLPIFTDKPIFPFFRKGRIPLGDPLQGELEDAKEDLERARTEHEIRQLREKAEDTRWHGLEEKL